MKHYFKRMIALILVVAMLTELVPAAFAENTNVAGIDTTADILMPERGDVVEEEMPVDAGASAVETAEEAEEGQPSATVVGEVSELRGESEKHFRMEDGSYIAVDYGIPVHFSTDGGETWEDIDNTLMLSETSELNSVQSVSGKAAAANYTAENGTNVHSFAHDLSSGFLFSAQNGDHGIQMALTDGATEANMQASIAEETAELEDVSEENLATGQESILKDFNTAAVAEISYPDSGVKNALAADLMTAEQVQAAETSSTAGALTDAGKEDAPDLAEQVTPVKLRADIAYRDVFDGVDLLYELYSYNVKETILVKQRRDNYAFTFYMELGDLTPMLKEDGSVELVDGSGEVIYLIPAPYMVDANDAVSDAVSYEIAKTGSGTWALTVTADPAWINADERAFPVAIDPTVVLYPYSGSDNILTSYVNSGRPTTASYNNTGFLRSGYYTNTSSDSTCTGYTVGLIYFKDLPKIPDNCVVTDAQLGLTQVKYGGLGNANYHKLYATTIPEPADPKTYLSGMTWNSYTANILPKYKKFGGESTATALDYQKELDHANTETLYVITNAVQRWYDESDTSISRLLVLDDGHSDPTNARVTYAGYAYGGAYAPKIYVTYRNTVGIEGIYGYHTQNIGRAGAGYVNDFTLQPTLLVPIISAPSNTLPFSIQLIYNGALSYSHFTSDTTNEYSDASNIHTLNYSTAKAGLGWKTSVQQTVKYAFYYVDGAYLQYLVYTDADGTEHYFNKTNSAGTVYKDEDGLGLTITTYNTDLFTMKDKEGNTWEFTWGYLTQYTDSNGNQLFYAYDGKNYASASTSWKPTNNTSSHRVTGVWRKNDGGDLQKIATLTYSGEYLTKIQDAANRTTTLGYDNGRLVSITFPDGETASYEYSPWTNANKRTYYRLLRAYDNEADYKIEYDYQDSRPLQVSHYNEGTKSGNEWINGQRVNCFQSYANYSRFRYFDTNDYSGNGKCVTLHYFDSWGRTVNVVTMNAEETEILGVSTGAYTANEEGSSKNNRLINAASAGIQSINLLQNADLEHTTDLYGWTKDSSGGNAASRADSGTTVLVKPYLGQYLMKLYESGVNSGEYTVRQSVYLEANKTYVFSAYANTACTETFGTNGGAYLSFLQSETQKAKSRVLNYKTNTSVDGGWERLEVTFTPTTSGTYAVAANINNISRIAVFDNFQLEKAADLNASDQSSQIGNAGTASAYNLLQAGSFEFPKLSTGVGSSADVNQWWTYNTAQAVPTTTKAHTGKVGLTFAPSVTGKQHASQVVPIYGSSNKTYILSGWGLTPQTNIKSSKEMEEDNKNECRFFGLIAKVTYTDTSLTPDYHYVSFNDSIDQWQFASGVIVPKQRDKTVATITVYACLDYCANRAYMDDISLIQEPVQTYDYDEEGNLVSASNSEGKTATTYDSSDRLTKYTSMSGVQYSLAYTGTSRDPASITSDGVKTSYTYDSAGNVTQTKTQPTSGSLYLQSSAGYDGTMNFQTSATDTNGTTVSRTYNPATGDLKTSTAPTGAGSNVITNYDTNAANGRPTTTYQSGIAALYYTYGTDGSLAQLNRKTFRNGAAIWQAYGFTYDDWGNTTKITVSKATGDDGEALSSGKTLASYTYNPSGTVATMTYPNGNAVYYEYDLFDRPVHEVYTGNDGKTQAEYYYVYSADGALAKQYSVSAGGVIEEYNFEYDSLGRLIRSRESNASGPVQRTEHLYDTANRLTQQSWTVGSDSFTERYTYNGGDGALSTVTTATGDKQSYSYDTLKRLGMVTTANAAGTTLFYTARSYAAGASTNQTTNRLSGFAYRKSGGDIINYNTYTYDAAGNITQINEVLDSGTRVLAKYSYDAQNQLTQEIRYNYSGTSVSRVATTVTYTYDTAGNLLSYKEGNTTHRYTYSDADWADKLSQFDGEAINYDNGGNPINWYNGASYTNLTWTQGRQLAGLTKGISQITYAYDMEGVRTSKKVSLTRYEYVTQNGKVVRETARNGRSVTYTLDFIYDVNGSPFAMIYTTASGVATTFYYVLNAQGDVVSLIDSYGTVYASYTYDAWGKPLTAQSYSSSYPQLHTVNPLRYRGYYYDNETGWYYLQSRYYDPIVKRFLNADAFASTGQGFVGTNMFAYCQNNPTNRHDSGGNVSEKDADEIIAENADAILAAGEEFDIDPVIIAACIYTEQVQNVNFLDQFDLAFHIFCSIDTSIGIGQVKVSTAQMLEDLGYVEKTEESWCFIFYSSRKNNIAVKLENNSENIRYAAAYLRYLADKWNSTFNISNKADILATLYNLGTNANAPNTSPKANAFGQYAKSKYDHLYAILMEEK